VALSNEHRNFPNDLSGLEWAHPLVRDWFVSRFGTPTEPQQEGWPSILARQAMLISAPTGSGKTLAVFLVSIWACSKPAISFSRRSSNLEYDSGRFEHSNVSRWRASSLQGRRAPTARKAGWRSTTPGYSNDAAVENSGGRSDSIIGSQRNKITKRTALSLLNRDI